MTNTFSQEHQALLADITAAEQRLKSLNEELDGIKHTLDDKSGEHQQYHLLEEICSSLDQLREMGAEALFWGDDGAAIDSEQHMARVRAIVGDFQKQVSSIEEKKQSLEKDIQRQAYAIDSLNDELDWLIEQEERAKYDYVIEREERELPFRPMFMPWSKQGEDERRFRKTLLITLLLAISFGLMIPYWELPVVENEVIEIPEHLVKLVKKQKPKPKPPEKKPEKKEEKKEEKKDEKKEAKEKPKPTPAETKQARQKAATSGLLAFKDNFQDLLADDVDAKLGASANLSNKGAKAKGDATRSLVMSQAKDSSGGINTAKLSKGIAGGAGKKIGGVGFSRVESAIGTDMIADDRPLSDGQGPSRTDEEIQIVFDRYKSALYRIYNRELRNNPTLKGKMVLRITIMPDGSVSAVKVESSDMDSPALSSKIVARVKNFNFGPKDGVPPTTILYPIDFLPAT